MGKSTRPRILHGWAVLNERSAQTKKYVYLSAHLSKSATIKAHCLQRKQSWVHCQASGDRIVRYDMFELGRPGTA